MFSRLLLTTITILFSAVSGNATTLILAPGNIVTGATGIIDGGVAYDVSLIDGRCDNIFSGCNEDADFAPLVEADFLAVARVLVAFFTEIDSSPLLDKTNILGCGNISICKAYAPVFFNEITGSVSTAVGEWNGGLIQAGTQGFAPSLIGASDAISDWTNSDFLVWARVSNSVAPVPVPAAFPLLAGGVAVLGLLGWRRKRMVAPRRWPVH